MPGKCLHNHCFQFRYVLAVFSEKAKTMLMPFFFEVVGRGGKGLGGRRGWVSKVRQSGKYHLSNRGVRFIGVCYTGVLL